jgi:hypothetical protein
MTLGMKDNPWVRLPAYVTGLVNQELLLKNEYLAAENRILRAHLPTRLRLSDLERSTRAEIGKRRAESLGPSGLRSQARYNSGLVSETDCPQVRWLPVHRLGGLLKYYSRAA